MKCKKTDRYILHYPDDISLRILALFDEAFTRLNTLTDLKPKNPTITFCRNNQFVVDLIVEERISEYWKDIIVYNLEKIEGKDELSIAIILLEELVHCYCDTLDEKIAGLIVAALIPEIEFDVAGMQYKKKTT